MSAHKLVFVEWDDAAFRETGWHSVEEIDPAHTMHTAAAGFLVKEDKKGLVLAVDYDPENDKWRGLTFIPRGMVKRKRVFKVMV